MQGARITMRDGRVYENMDLRGANNGSQSGVNLMFTPRDHAVGWIELNSNTILSIDWSSGLAEEITSAVTPVSTDAARNQSNKDIRDGDSTKDVAQGVN